MSINVKNMLDSPAFVAGDLTEIRELLHPLKGGPDLPYSLAFGTLGVGKSSVPHRLKKSKEVYYILSGTARIKVEKERHTLNASDYFCVPENSLQSVENTGEEELMFLCIVSPPWTAGEEDVSGK